MAKATKRKAEELTGMYEVLDTVEAIVNASEPALKAALIRVFNAYSRDFPDEYFWATGPQAPALLHNLMFALMPSKLGDKAKSVPLRSI